MMCVNNIFAENLFFINNKIYIHDICNKIKIFITFGNLTAVYEVDEPRRDFDRLVSIFLRRFRSYEKSKNVKSCRNFEVFMQGSRAYMRT